MEHRTVFVFSGGAARGAVQLGMMDALLRRDIVPDALIGTSVGALNAAYLSWQTGAERLEGLREAWLGLSARDVFPGGYLRVASHLARERSSLYSSDGLRRLIDQWLPVRRFEELTTPLRVVTTELATGRAVYHHSGALADVLLASTALPAIFAPVRLTDAAGGTTPHVDGGVADLVPVAGALDLAPTRIFVLDASVPVRLRRARNPIDVLVASLGAAIRRPLVQPGLGVEVHHFTCPDLGIRMNDFSRTNEHIAMGRTLTAQALATRAAAAA